MQLLHSRRLLAQTASSMACWVQVPAHKTGNHQHASLQQLARNRQPSYADGRTLLCKPQHRNDERRAPRAKRRPTHRAHRVRRLLLVRSTVVSSLGIKVSHGGPAPLARVQGATQWALRDAILTQNDVAEDHTVFVGEVLHNLVPLGGLLASSASAFRRNEADEHRLARVHGRLHFVVEVRSRQFRGVLPVIVWVDAGRS